MSSADVIVKVAFDGRAFMLGIEQVSAAIQTFGEAARRTGLPPGKFIYWLDYAMFFNLPDPSAALLRVAETRWPR